MNPQRSGAGIVGIGGIRPSAFIGAIERRFFGVDRRDRDRGCNEQGKVRCHFMDRRVVRAEQTI